MIFYVQENNRVIGTDLNLFFDLPGSDVPGDYSKGNHPQFFHGRSNQLRNYQLGYQRN
jgi:hypothetical protein